MSIRSSAWLVSLGIHGFLVVVLSFCYVTELRLTARVVDSVPIAMHFEPEVIPAVPVEEPQISDPVPPMVVEAREAIAEVDLEQKTELPPDPPEVMPTPDEDALKLNRQELAEADPQPHFVAKGKKPELKPVPSSTPDAGGSRAGSGAAPALIAIASANGIAMANGLNGSGPGSGLGRGSGQGSHPGDGTPAGDGKGYGTGHGDGIGSGSGPGREGGGVDRLPRVDKLERPEYPKDARRAGIEGTVRCLVQVLASGKVGEVKVFQSSGNSDLDHAACDALKRSRFFPAEVNGKPVRFDELIVPYVYKIQRN
jgi:TonB family protein